MKTEVEGYQFWDPFMEEMRAAKKMVGSVLAWLVASVQRPRSARPVKAL